MFITMALVPILRMAAVRLHAGLDVPNPRKVHTEPVPKVGGLAMAIGALVPVVLVADGGRFVNSVLIGACVIVLFGLVDDLKSLGWKAKFAGQVAAALIVIVYGKLNICYLGCCLPEGVRLLAKRYHPDNIGSGSVEKFDIITKAYKALSQPEKRAAYDATYAEKKSRVLKAYAQAFAPGEVADSIRLLEHISAETSDKFEEAITNLDKKVAANSDNLIAWAFLAYMHSRLGHKRRATKAAGEAQRVNSLFSVEEFSQTLKFKNEEGRVRFREYSKLAGLN